MLVMLDDIQFKDEETFFTFMSQSLGLGVDGIDNLDKLYDVVSEYDDELEIIINDYDDVTDDMRKFAKKAVGVFMDCRMVNKKLEVTFMHDVDDDIVVSEALSNE